MPRHHTQPWGAGRFGYDSDVHMGRDLLTLANALSGLRLVCAPVCAWAIVAGEARWAAGTFVLAVITDLADGRAVRSRPLPSTDMASSRQTTGSSLRSHLRYAHYSPLKARQPCTPAL